MIVHFDRDIAPLITQVERGDSPGRQKLSPTVHSRVNLLESTFRKDLKERLCLVGVVLLALLLTLGPSLTRAQNVGKLAGSVTDQATGVPLPGATVVIEGTNFGAAANSQGEYFILGLPVGNYTVLSSFVGFNSLVFTGVEINQDYTKELNFSLTEDVTALGELVVEYERPLIQKDAIGVPRVVTGKEIENLSVRGIIPVAAIQGGVVAREGQRRTLCPWRPARGGGLLHGWGKGDRNARRSSAGHSGTEHADRFVTREVR